MTYSIFHAILGVEGTLIPRDEDKQHIERFMTMKSTRIETESPTSNSAVENAIKCQSKRQISNQRYLEQRTAKLCTKYPKTH